MRILKFKPVLSKWERKLIKRIARMQISSLTSILENEHEDWDIYAHCSEWEIAVDEFIGETKYSLSKYERLLRQPEAFFSFDETNTDICRHLLMGPLKRKKGRRYLMRKLDLIDSYPFSLN